MNELAIVSFFLFFVVFGVIVFAGALRFVAHGTLRHWDAWCIALLLFHLGAVAVYSVSWLLDGRVIGTGYVAAGLLIVSLAGAVYVAWPKLADGLAATCQAARLGDGPSQNALLRGAPYFGAVVILMIPAVLRVFGEPWPGDLGGNTLLINQLRLGIVPPDVVPFKEVLSRPYPFQSFVLPAVASHLFGIGGGIAYLGHMLVVTLATILTTWALFTRLTGRRWTALVASAVALFFSGFATTSDFNLSLWSWGAQVVQADYLPRVSGFVALILSLYFLVRYHQNGKRRFDVFCIGGALGVLFCTHPYPLLFAGLIFLLYFGLFARDLRTWIDGFTIGITALLVGAPAAIAILLASFGPVEAVDACTKAEGLNFPLPYDQLILTGATTLDVYGIFVVFIVVGIWGARRHESGWLWSIVAGATALAFAYTIARAMLKNEYGIFLPLHPMQHRLSFAVHLLGGISLLLLLDRVLALSQEGCRPILAKAVPLVSTALVAATGYSAVAYVFHANNVMGNAWWFYQSEFDFHIADRLLDAGIDADSVISNPDSVSPLLAFQTGVNVLSFVNSPGGFTPCRYTANAILQSEPKHRERIAQAGGVPFDDVFDRVLKKYGITHLVVPEANQEYAMGRNTLSMLTEGRDYSDTVFKVFSVDQTKLAGAASINLKDTALYSAAVGMRPMCVKSAVPHRVSNMVRRQIGGFHATAEAFWLLDNYKRELLRVDRYDGAVLRTFPISEKIERGIGLAQRAGSLELLDKDGAVWRLDLEQGTATRIVVFADPTVRSLAWDGSFYVTVNTALDRVQRISPESGAVVETQQVYQTHHGAVVITANGDLLVSNNLGGRLCRVKLDGEKSCYFNGSGFGVFYLAAAEGRIFANMNGWYSVSELTLDRHCDGPQSEADTQRPAEELPETLQ